MNMLDSRTICWIQKLKCQKNNTTIRKRAIRGNASDFVVHYQVHSNPNYNGIYMVRLDFAD